MSEKKVTIMIYTETKSILNLMSEAIDNRAPVTTNPNEVIQSGLFLIIMAKIHIEMAKSNIGGSTALYGNVNNRIGINMT